MPIPSPWPALRGHFPESQYALLREVRDKAGHEASRTADGIAMHLWPSRGLEVNGLEIKAYRSDWLKELKTPEKAENIYKYCDRWWIVAACEGVVKKDEVPVNWGFMQVKNDRVYRIKEAPKLEPIPLSRDFIAAMLKRATQGMIDKKDVDARIAGQIAEAKQEGAKGVGSLEAHYKREMESRQRIIDKFQEASGIDIGNGWDSERIGETVKLLLEVGIEQLINKLSNTEKHMADVAKHLKDALTSLS